MARKLFFCITGAVLALVLAVPATTQDPQGGRKEILPQEIQGVYLEQKIGAEIPLRAEFKDETGRKVTLGDYFDGKRPVLLTLNYFRCPMLCGLQLNALLNGGDLARMEGRRSGLQGLDWTPGKEFTLVTVSFDPLETPNLARLKKQNYMKVYGRPAAAGGWHFLTGLKNNIQSLTEAVGFHYKWNVERREYAHPMAVVACTPDGKVSQYLTGFVYETEDLKRALETASRGEAGSLLHQALVFTCFQYDPGAGTYAADAMKIMRSGGMLTVLALGIFLFILWRRSARQKANTIGESES